MAQPQTSTGPKIPKFVLNVQMFLLRRGMMGKMGEQLMIITTTGRKTGKRHSVPIGGVADNGHYLAFTIGGRSNWYKNVLKTPVVTLEAQRRTFQARGEPITEDADILKVLAHYAEVRPGMFERFFGVKPADRAHWLKAKEKVVFVRFTPV